MNTSTKFVGLAMTMIVGTACAQEPDPCATSGTACVWAGIGERGFNIANPNADRLQSKLYLPRGPDLRARRPRVHRRLEQPPHPPRRGRRLAATVVGTDYEGDGPPEMEDRLPLCNPAGALGDDRRA